MKATNVTLSIGEEGLGVEIIGGTDDPVIPDDTGIYVSAVKPDGAVARNGIIQPGDRVISVNRHDLSAVSHDRACRLFQQAKLKGSLSMEIEPRAIEGLGSSNESVNVVNGSISDPNQPSSPREIKEVNESRIVLDNLVRMFEEKLFTDCSVLVGPRAAQKTYLVHRGILAAHSRVFKDLLSSTGSGRGLSQAVVEIPDIATDTAESLLRYMYSGRIAECACTLKGLAQLLAAANRYEIGGLELICQRRLGDLISPANICELLLVSKRYKCRSLMRRCMKYLMVHCQVVISSGKWSSLKAQDAELVVAVLESLVKSLAPQQQRRLHPDGPPKRASSLSSSRLNKATLFSAASTESPKTKSSEGRLKPVVAPRPQLSPNARSHASKNMVTFALADAGESLLGVNNEADDILPPPPPMCRDYVPMPESYLASKSYRDEMNKNEAEESAHSEGGEDENDGVITLASSSTTTSPLSSGKAGGGLSSDRKREDRVTTFDVYGSEEDSGIGMCGKEQEKDIFGRPINGPKTAHSTSDVAGYSAVQKHHSGVRQSGGCGTRQTYVVRR